MWIRAALLAHIFNVDHQISRFFHDQLNQWGERPSESRTTIASKSAEGFHLAPGH